MTHAERYWLARFVHEVFESPANIGFGTAEEVLDYYWKEAHCTVNPMPELSEIDRSEVLRMAK